MIQQRFTVGPSVMKFIIVNKIKIKLFYIHSSNFKVDLNLLFKGKK